MELWSCGAGGPAIDMDPHDQANLTKLIEKYGLDVLRLSAPERPVPSSSWGHSAPPPDESPCVTHSAEGPAAPSSEISAKASAPAPPPASSAFTATSQPNASRSDTTQISGAEQLNLPSSPLPVSFNFTPAVSLEPKNISLHSQPSIP